MGGNELPNGRVASIMLVFKVLLLLLLYSFLGCNDDSEERKKIQSILLNEKSPLRSLDEIKKEGYIRVGVVFNPTSFLFRFWAKIFPVISRRCSGERRRFLPGLLFTPSRLVFDLTLLLYRLRVLALMSTSTSFKIF